MTFESVILACSIALYAGMITITVNRFRQLNEFIRGVYEPRVHHDYR
jgi:hypothetical protein